MKLLDFITRQPTRVGFGFGGGRVAALDVSSDSDGLALTPLPSGITSDIPAATQSDAGVMSAADKTKLDGLQQGIDVDAEQVATRGGILVATVDPGVTHIRTAGYATAGDGGDGLYRRASSQPAHAARVQSGDGTWWELVPHPSSGIAVEQLGAAGDNATDDTLAFNEALSAAGTLGITMVRAPGEYVIGGTILTQPGVVLKGNAITGPYFRTITMSNGSRLRRPNGVSTAPMLQMVSQSCISGLIFDYEEVDGCPDGIISAQASTILVNCVTENIAVFGTHTAPAGNVDPTTACIGLNWARWGKLGDAMYMNRFVNMHVQNCDIGFYLGNQFNANNLATIHTQNNYLHYLLDGQTGECLENIFTNLGLFSINLPAPMALGFKMTNANNNAFAGVTTEMFGKLIEANAENCKENVFSGMVSNEIEASGLEAFNAVSGNENFDPRERRPVTRFPYQAQLLPHSTPDDSDYWSFARGSKSSQFFRVTNNLPECAGPGTGALNAGDVNNRVLFRLGSAFSAALMPDAFYTLKIVVPRPFGSGDSLIDVDFMTRMRDQTAGLNTLGVFKVNKFDPSELVSGLWFLTGASDGQPYGIALVCSGYAAGFQTGDIAISLDVVHKTFDQDVQQPVTMYRPDTNGAFDVSAGDVADAIDLLTTASIDF